MNKRNRFVSARGALLAIAIALLLTGQLPAGEDDAKAEQAIEALGGRVVRDDKTKGKPIIAVDGPGGGTVALLKELRGLKSLQTLNIGNTSDVTDVVLKELAGLKSLQTLDIRETTVTDA